MMLFGVVHAQVETDVATDEAAMIQISKGSEAGHLGVTFSADEGLDDGVEGRAKCSSFQTKGNGFVIAVDCSQNSRPQSLLQARKML